VFSSLRSNLIPSLVIGQSSPFNLRSPGSIIADNARVSPWTNRVADRSERERKETRRLLEDVIARSRTWPDILAIPIRDVIRGAGCWLHERGKDHIDDVARDFRIIVARDSLESTFEDAPIAGNMHRLRAVDPKRVESANYVRRKERKRRASSR